MTDLLPVGTRVLICPSSDYYLGGWDSSNPSDTEGTITQNDNSEWEGDDHVYSVIWDNNTTNSYRVEDLIPVKPVKPKGLVAFLRKHGV